MDTNKIDYTRMENLLTRIHGQCIKLPKSDVQRNNILLNQVINQIIDKMKIRSKLFANMYREKYYGGSFYDDLKIGQPDEYDLDCLLYLPKDAGAVIETSDQHGYVYIQLKNMEKFKEKNEYLDKFKGLERLLDAENYLLTGKVLNWMESVINLALNDFDHDDNYGSVISFTNNGQDEEVFVKVYKNGPALMLKIIGTINDEPFYIDVDLVTCFKFFDGQWPSKDEYTPNPSKTFHTFFIVPKSYKNISYYWRLSFQEQERELLQKDYKTLKPTIRLLKKIRDNFKHNIASYHIKTIFLRELKYGDESIWKGTLSNTFMFMLKKYANYINNGVIPYYWNEHHNLIGNLDPVNLANIANFLKRMIADIDRNISTDVTVVAKYLIPNKVISINGIDEPISFSDKILQGESSYDISGEQIQQESSSWCTIS